MIKALILLKVKGTLLDICENKNRSRILPKNREVSNSLNNRFSLLLHNTYLQINGSAIMQEMETVLISKKKRSTRMKSLAEISDLDPLVLFIM